MANRAKDVLRTQTHKFCVTPGQYQYQALCARTHQLSKNTNHEIFAVIQLCTSRETTAWSLFVLIPIRCISRPEGTNMIW